MYREVAKLVLYRDLGEDSILRKLSGIFEDWEKKESSGAELITRIYEQIKALLDLSTMYGFDTNLWHNYLTFILLTNENSFSMTSEKVGANDGSVNHFAKGDFRVFQRLFEFDFGPIERDLGIDCFSTICNYRAIGKKERMYNKNVSEKVQAVSLRIEKAEDEEEIFTIVTDFYKAYGVGMFGLNKAFRIKSLTDGVEFLPINNTEQVLLDDLVGYELQKQKLIDNTEAFVKGLPANNVLLFGDSGTGKSTSIKAILNEYYDKGLRMIEIYKHQFQDLSAIIAQIKNRNYRFVIYMDDLSFGEFEIEYKFLKAVIAPFRYNAGKTFPGGAVWCDYLLFEAFPEGVFQDCYRIGEAVSGDYIVGAGALCQGKSVGVKPRRNLRADGAAVYQLSGWESVIIKRRCAFERYTPPFIFTA